MIRRAIFWLILLTARVCGPAAAQPYPITPESNGDHRFPDVVSWGGYDCGALPTNSVAGALGHCKNCLAGSDPAVCGGRGCNIERIADNTGTLRWRCVAGMACPGATACAFPTVQTGVDEECQPVCSTAPGLCQGAAACTPPEVQTGIDADCRPVCSGPTCTFMQCAPPTVVVGHDANCNDICSSDFCTPNPCQNGGQCILTGNGFLCLCPCNCSGTLCQTCVTTSTTTTTTTTTSGAPTTTGTGATTTTTTTTTSTTSTTATTLPVFASTSFLLEPDFPTDTGSTDYTLIPNGPDFFHNQMACARVPEMIGITNATKMAALLTASCEFPFRSVNFAVYEDSDSGAKLASFLGGCSGAAGVVSAVGLPPFSLVRGTVYRYCTCNNSAGGGPVGAYGSTHWLTTGFGSEQNVFVPSVGTAANTCASATMPATTGALTPNGALGAPLILISRE